MKLFLFLLFYPFYVLASPIPSSIDLPEASESVLGYKVEAWQEFDGSVTKVFDNVMFYNRRYLACITPVLHGLNDDGTHRVDISSYNCHWVQKSD